MQHDAGDDRDRAAVRADLPDARAILRQKTLLGETYVELTTGAQNDGSSGGTDSDDDHRRRPLQRARSTRQISGDDAPSTRSTRAATSTRPRSPDQTQIDEIFNGFDEQTRNAFRLWQQNSAIAIKGRGLDLNDAFGNLGPFSTDASDVLGDAAPAGAGACGRWSTRHRRRLRCAHRSATRQLAGAIVGTNRTFRRARLPRPALADTFKIFPTFKNETRLHARPPEELRGATPARCSATCGRWPATSARRCATSAASRRSAASLFNNLDPLIKASATGLPSLREHPRRAAAR